MHCRVVRAQTIAKAILVLGISDFFYVIAKSNYTLKTLFEKFGWK